MVLTVDLTGQKFNRLLVISESNKGMDSHVMWRCLCDCGETTVVRATNLRSGNTKSCGCLGHEGRPKNALRHGHSSERKMTTEYRAWWAMKARCTVPHHPSYKNYGGRGIKVCRRWLKSFDKFLEDMGSKPQKGLTLDRINNDGNYEPGNCRWATKSQQSRNTRKTRPVIRGDGVNFPSIADAAESVGCSPASVHAACSGRQATAFGYVWNYADSK